MQAVSIRFSDPAVRERLREEAATLGQSGSALAERLIREGLRMARHPRVVFRDGPTGRRAGLAGGPDVAEVVGAIVGAEVTGRERIARAAELLALPGSHVEAALAYYAEFTDEIDAEMNANRDLAAREERLWREARALADR